MLSLLLRRAQVCLTGSELCLSNKVRGYVFLVLSRPSLVGRPCFYFSFSSFFETSSFAIRFYHMSLLLFPGSRDSATPWKTDPNLSLRLRSDNSQTLSLGTLCQDDAYRAPNPRWPMTLAKCLSGAGVERFRLPHSPTIPQWAPHQTACGRPQRQLYNDDTPTRKPPRQPESRRSRYLCTMPIFPRSYLNAKFFFTYARGNPQFLSDEDAAEICATFGQAETIPRLWPP